MPTSSEKKALGFLAGVAILGAAVRMSGAVADASAADSSSREALRRQIVAAESAGAAQRRRKQGGALDGRVTPATPRRTRGHPVVAGPVFDSAAAPSRDLFDAPPPPAPRSARGRKSAMPAVPIDVDQASASELEALPRIGPALAKRIVDDREARGPFGSIEGFQRVRGVGPAMAAALSGAVTFSGTPRPSIAGGVRLKGSMEPPGVARRRRAPP
jgi:competence protein ComEA